MMLKMKKNILLIKTFLLFCFISLYKSKSLLESKIENINMANVNACRHIYYISKKGCSVGPRTDEFRCCYITWKEGNNDEFTGVKGKCDYMIDTKSYMKEYKNYMKQNGFNNPKIQCRSDLLTLPLISLLIYILVLF